LLCILQKTNGEVKLGFNGDLYPTAGASVVMTTSGDMVKYQSGARARLGIGSANQILQVKSSLPSWETVDLADTVLTVAGDILFENATPELARLPKGTQYNNLQMGASLPAWSASSSSVLTASGDVLYASGANTLAKLAKASDGDTLQLASGVPAWVTVSAGGLLSVLGTYEATSAESSHTFSFTAVDFEDDSLLILEFDGNAQDIQTINIRLNEDSNGVYNSDGTIIASGGQTIFDTNSQTSGSLMGVVMADGGRAMSVIAYISLSIPSSDKYPMILSRGQTNEGVQTSRVLMGVNTANITDVEVLSSGTWEIGARATLYKLARA